MAKHVPAKTRREIGTGGALGDGLLRTAAFARPLVPVQRAGTRRRSFFRFALLADAAAIARIVRLRFVTIGCLDLLPRNESLNMRHLKK